MAKPENSKPGCFSNFLKVLLCAGNGTSPPVHPSEPVEETEHVHVHSKKDKKLVDDAANAITPNVVARLMGLDSLPKTNFVVKKGETPDSVPRSRSVNFVDYLLEFDLNLTNQHRRVKTSASFREVPSLFHRQKSDPSLLDIDDSVSKVEEEKKLEMGLGEWKQRKRQGSKSKEIVRVKKERNQGKNKKISKLKNEPRRVPSSSSKYSSKVRNYGEANDLCKSCNYSYYGNSDAGSSSSSSSCSPTPLPNRHKKGVVEPKMTRNMKNQMSPKRMQTEHSMENLSPVSVLGVNDYPFLYGADFQGTSTLASKSKWKSSLKVSLDDGVEDKAGNNKGYAHTEVNKEAEYYSELMLKIRTLTEKNIRESDWTSKRMWGTESLEEICLVFAHRIFDLLLFEVVNEVVELCS